MNRSLNIYADMILSFNGEDLFIKATKKSIMLSTPSVRSGLRALLSLNEHHKIHEISTELNSALKEFGLTLYAQIGIFRFAVLGSRGGRSFLKALFFFGRIGRTLGVV